MSWAASPPDQKKKKFKTVVDKTYLWRKRYSDMYEITEEIT